MSHLHLRLWPSACIASDLRLSLCVVTVTLCVHPFGRLTKSPSGTRRLRRGVESCGSPIVATVMGRGAMKNIKSEVIVRGSAAAVGLMVLVSVVGAGTKWMR